MSEAYLARCWENIKSYEEVIVNSIFTREWLYKGISPFQSISPITVLSPPVQTALSQNSPKPANRPTILSIGRFFAGGHDKRHDILIAGLRRLIEECPQCELHIVGSLHASQTSHYSELLQKVKGFQ